MFFGFFFRWYRVIQGIFTIRVQRGESRVLDCVSGIQTVWGLSKASLTKPKDIRRLCSCASSERGMQEFSNSTILKWNHTLVLYKNKIFKYDKVKEIISWAYIDTLSNKYRVSLVLSCLNILLDNILTSILLLADQFGF